MSCSKWRIDIALYVGGDLPVKRVARTVAHLRGETAEHLAASTTRNAIRFFGLEDA